MENTFSRVGSTIAAAFTAKKILDFGMACISTAADAETAFAKVSTLLSTGTDTDIYFDTIRKGAQESGMALTDFTEAVYQSISASVDQGKAVGFTATAAKLARGGFTDVTTAVDVLTTVLNAYGMKQKDALKVSDRLIKTQNLGKTTVGELANVMARSIPTASSYNVSLDELCGIYAVMTKNGNPAAEATTLMNSMLNELGKSGTKTANILKEETGKSFSELMASGASLTDVLDILNGSASRSGLAINDLFGSAEAGRSANILIGQAEDLTAAIKEIGDAAGTTEAANATMMNTYAEQLKTLQNNWSQLKEEIGRGLLPTANKVVSTLNNALTGKAYKNRKGVFQVDAESAEEAYSNAMKYKSVMDDLNNQYSGDNAGMLWNKADTKAYNQAEGYYSAYLDLAKQIEQANEDMGDSGDETAIRMQNAVSEYITGIEEITQKHIENYKQIRANIEGWFGPFEKADQKFKISYDDIKKNLESQRDFFTKYQEDAQYLADNGLGAVVEKLQTMGTDGAGYVTAFAEEMRSVGPDGIEDVVTEITTLMETVSGLKDSLAGTLETGSGNAVEELTLLTDTFNQTVEGMDKSEEATEAANSTMASFIAALSNSRGEIDSVMGNLGAAMTSSLQAHIGTVYMTVSANLVMGGRSSAIGMDYVPYNGMPAILHRGEAVLNSYEADQWRRGRSGGNAQGIVVNQTIQSVPQTPIQLAAATQAMFEQARWAF